MMSPSTQLIWAWILTVGPIVFCIALWVYMQTRR
jgi:hypothetical protein